MDDDAAQAQHPPHDVQAERAALQAMFLGADAVADVAQVLSPDDFYRSQHRLICATIFALHAANKPTDPAEVSAALAKDNRLDEAGGMSYLSTLATGRPKKGSWNNAADRVQALAVLRRTAEAAVRIENLAAEGTAENIGKIVEAAQETLFRATTRHAVSVPPAMALGDILEGSLDNLEALDSKGPAGIPTGFADLDRLTGGLHPGQLIVVAARPAMGKSTFAVDLLREASIQNNIAAVLFTLESSRDEIATRILSAEARVALHHMRSGSMTDDDWTRLARRMPDVSAAPLFIQDSSYATFTDLRAQCRRLRTQQRIELIVVDALHMLTFGTRPFASRYEEISEISRCLKLLAKELEVPVVAVSQLNRGPEQRTDKKPMINDLRDSGALEDNADMIILLHREDAYEKESPRAGEADLIVAKHRHGPTATITVAFQGHYSRFVDMAQ
jgi:replicative DNA helicase